MVFRFGKFNCFNFSCCVSTIFGAIADRGTAKKKLLIFFAFLGIIATGGLWIVNQGHWQMAILFYIIASIGFMSGNIFYDALLPA
ncbi:MAG: hypothetical protein CM1200mP1_06710 [Candidatus Neomarinimicrobiota bacterium]|nr:MAG: hypothetical protein CM1200mP1_06710 [Candidatus Neomarinimicrobiota bacterium]